jgi:hypothetical protein
LGITTLVVDISEVQCVDGRESLTTTTRSEVDVTGDVVEHPDCDSDTKLTATTDQEVRLAKIEQLGSGVNSNVLRTRSFDDEDLGRSDVLDWGKLERIGHVRIKDGVEESGQLGRVLLRQGGNVDDPGGRSICREFDGIAGLLVVNIETEGGDDIDNESEIDATSGVENEVESFDTGSLKPFLGSRKSGRSGGVHSDRLDVNAELSRQDASLRF